MGQGQSSDYALGYSAGEFDYIYGHRFPAKYDEYLASCSPSYCSGYEDGKQRVAEQIAQWREQEAQRRE